MTQGDDTEGRRRQQRHRDLAPDGDGLDGDERRRVEERLRLLVALSEATRGDSDAATVMATTTRMLGLHLGVTHCAYADVERDSNHFTIREDWHVPGTTSLAGELALDDFGPLTAKVLRSGRTLVIGDVDAELGPHEGAAAYRALDVRASLCTALVKEGRLVAMMAVHSQTPRAWTAGEIALLEEVVERCWAHIERVRSAGELRAAARQKDEFLATLAHELRNPLAPIRTAVDVLKRAESGPDAERALRTMDRQLSHLVRLVDDLLDMSRITRGKLELRSAPTDLRAVIEATVEASRPFIEAAGHQLMITTPVGPLPIDGDVARLTQALTNLLHNAAKYTLARGRIDLVVERAPGAVVLQVKDTGAGIAAADLPFVFEPFHQSAATAARAQGGLGIGLALVKKVIEMHGGTVTAASAGAGQGTTLTIRLPVREPTEPPPPDSSVRVGLPGVVTAKTGRRVLVVDDNVDAAEMLAMMLRLEGHRARIVHDGASAIASIQSEPTDVVFLDLGMPDMDGFDVARELRADPALAELKIVALTGWGSAEDKRQTREAGIDVHLTKPIKAEALTALLARLFG